MKHNSLKESSLKCEIKENTIFLWIDERGKKIYLKYLNYVIDKPLYYLDGLIKDMLKNNYQILFEVLKATDVEIVAIKLVNLGVEVIDDKSQKLKLFEILREKGFGKSSLTEIHFTPYSYSFSGSYVPVLEQKRDFLKKVKEIFVDNMDYIELVVYIDKRIDNYTEQIEKELEKEF